MSKTIAKPRATSASHGPSRDRQPSIELRDVRKLFGEVAAVDGVSLAIEPGEFLTLLGPSGCGKTTTLRMIGGFEFPSAGEVYIDGEAMGARPPYRRPVNTVFQNYALFPHLTVGQNVAYGLEMQRTPKAERRERVAAALAMVRLPQVEGRKPSELSGGQQQRVALARALVNRPAVLLLDEPLGALDLKLRKAMQLELKQLNREVGATFVYVTHDQEEALTMSDRIAVMNEGRILQVGPPADIYERPRNRFVADFIGQTNFLDVTILGVVVDQANVQIPGSPPVRVRLPAGGATRGPATLAIRPEKVFLMDDFGGAAPARWNALDATLVDVIYLGTHTHYVARLLGGAFVAVHRQNRAFGEAEPRVGDPIRIGFDPMSAMLLGE